MAYFQKTANEKREMEMRDNVDNVQELYQKCRDKNYNKDLKKLEFLNDLYTKGHTTVGSDECIGIDKACELDIYKMCKEISMRTGARRFGIEFEIMDSSNCQHKDGELKGKILLLEKALGEKQILNYDSNYIPLSKKCRFSRFKKRPAPLKRIDFSKLSDGSIKSPNQKRMENLQDIITTCQNINRNKDLRKLQFLEEIEKYGESGIDIDVAGTRKSIETEWVRNGYKATSAFRCASAFAVSSEVQHEDDELRKKILILEGRVGKNKIRSSDKEYGMLSDKYKLAKNKDGKSVKRRGFFL